MKKATIIHHQGFGDLMTSNPICNYYSEKYDELVIFVLDESRKTVVSDMYKHRPNIKCVIPDFIGENTYNSSCIICMAYGYPCRPESRYDGHKYIDYSKWTDYENIKIGCFKEDYKKWEKYLYDNMDNNISVCMATYNGSEYIREQISSILIQLGIGDELIVSDDTSTDNTIEIIQSFNDDRIKVVINSKCKSPIFNFENAIKQASNPLIFLSDQDDVWVENKVYEMKLMLNQYSMVVCNHSVVDENMTIIIPSYFELASSGKGVIKNIIKNYFKKL
jgi:hypothetical protein